LAQKQSEQKILLHRKSVHYSWIFCVFWNFECCAPLVVENNNWSHLGWNNRFQTFSFLWLPFLIMRKNTLKIMVILCRTVLHPT